MLFLIEYGNANGFKIIVIRHRKTTTSSPYLQSKLSDKNEEIVHLKQQYQHMLKQFRLGQQRQFGQSSESISNQTELFDEAEQVLDEPADKSLRKR